MKEEIKFYIGEQVKYANMIVTLKNLKHNTVTMEHEFVADYQGEEIKFPHNSVYLKKIINEES